MASKQGFLHRIQRLFQSNVPSAAYRKPIGTAAGSHLVYWSRTYGQVQYSCSPQIFDKKPLLLPQGKKALLLPGVCVCVCVITKGARARGSFELYSLKAFTFYVQLFFLLVLCSVNTGTFRKDKHIFTSVLFGGQKVKKSTYFIGPGQASHAV